MKPDIFGFMQEIEYYVVDSLVKQMLSEQSPICKYELNEYRLSRIVIESGFN